VPVLTAYFSGYNSAMGPQHGYQILTVSLAARIAPGHLLFPRIPPRAGIMRDPVMAGASGA